MQALSVALMSVAPQFFGVSPKPLNGDEVQRFQRSVFLIAPELIVPDFSIRESRTLMAILAIYATENPFGGGSQF